MIELDRFEIKSGMKEGGAVLVGGSCVESSEVRRCRQDTVAANCVDQVCIWKGTTTGRKSINDIRRTIRFFLKEERKKKKN